MHSIIKIEQIDISEIARICDMSEIARIWVWGLEFKVVGESKVVESSLSSLS